MNRVELGTTGLFVTPICIGAGALMNTGGVEVPISEQQAYSTMKAAFTSEFNFIDTAANYGDTERIIGEVLRDIGGLPDGYVLQTKVDRDSTTGDFSGEQVEKSLKQSLERLDLDCLQVVYIHDPEHTAFENIMSKGGALDVLKKYKDEGVIGHIGISGGPISMLIRYIQTGEFEAVVTHNRFNLLHRAAEPLLNEASRRGMAVLNAAPFGSGILASLDSNRFAYRPASKEIMARMKKIRAICRKYGVSTKAAAVQFSLNDPRITSTIVGPTSPEHIGDYSQLMLEKIPPEIFSKIEEHVIYSGDPEAGRFKTRLYSD